MFIGLGISRRSLGDAPSQTAILPERLDKKMVTFFTTDLTMSAEQLLTLQDRVRVRQVGEQRRFCRLSAVIVSEPQADAIERPTKEDLRRSPDQS